MNFEPQKLFIGLMDFFSVLLPGALLTYLFADEVGPSVLGRIRYEHLTGAQAVSALLVCSYLVGHFIFLVASGVLDELYDWARRHTLNTQIVLFARRGKLLPSIVRVLICIIFKRERNLAVGRASAIKAKRLAPLRAKDAINTFQWCKALLTKESPESMVVVQRFEADSKFFRSFVVVLIILLGNSMVSGSWAKAGFGVVLIMLALWRYMDQRLKATNQAYWSVITLTAQQGSPTLEPETQRQDGLTHAGGVVFRTLAGQTEYLLVDAKEYPHQHVLPKGHIEAGEQPRDTAVREVLEEAGYWATVVVGDLEPVSYQVGEKVNKVKFFVMRHTALGMRNADEVHRQRYWLPLDLAMEKATFPDAKELLTLASRIIAAESSDRHSAA